MVHIHSLFGQHCDLETRKGKTAPHHLVPFPIALVSLLAKLAKSAQTGVWAPFDLFSSFSASFGFAGGGGRLVGTTGSGSGALVTSVRGSFTRGQPLSKLLKLCSVFYSLNEGGGGGGG